MNIATWLAELELVVMCSWGKPLWGKQSSQPGLCNLLCYKQWLCPYLYHKCNPSPELCSHNPTPTNHLAPPPLTLIDVWTLPQLKHNNVLVGVGTPLDTTASHHDVYGNMCSGYQYVLALAFNNAFVIPLVKMWPGGTPHVVIRPLNLSLDWLLKKAFYD